MSWPDKINHPKATLETLHNNRKLNAAESLKIFLSMVQGCLELKNDLTFFNGNDFLIHVPHRYLIESIIRRRYK